MATITKKNLLNDDLPFSNVPYGNTVQRQASISLNASGVWTGSDSTSAVGATDKLRFGVLPAGMKLTDAYALVSTTFRASTTAKIGFEYVDGVDDSSVPQDDDYFFSGLALDAAALTRKTTTTRPVTLPKDAYLIYTNAVSAQNGDGVLDVVVTGEVIGVKD